MLFFIFYLIILKNVLLPKIIQNCFINNSFSEELVFTLILLDVSKKSNRCLEEKNRSLLGFKKSLFELLNRKRYLCAHEKVSEHKQESTCRAGCSCWNNRPVSDFSPEAPDE